MGKLSALKLSLFCKLPFGCSEQGLDLVRDRGVLGLGLAAKMNDFTRFRIDKVFVEIPVRRSGLFGEMLKQRVR